MAPRSAIAMQHRGYLGDAQVREVRLHDHLARELHPRRPKVQREDPVAAERAHPAVEVAALSAEEEARHE